MAKINTVKFKKKTYSIVYVISYAEERKTPYSSLYKIHSIYYFKKNIFQFLLYTVVHRSYHECKKNTWYYIYKYSSKHKKKEPTHVHSHALSAHACIYKARV